MTTIDEYTKEQILDFTWINTDYILTDYYWQKFRKSANPDFITKKGSRKRYYSERVYTQFCLWLIDLDISRARSQRRLMMSDIKEKLNEQLEELQNVVGAKEMIHTICTDPEAAEERLIQVEKYINLVTGGGIEKQRQEAEKQRMERLRNNLDNEFRKLDSYAKQGIISKEEANQFKKNLALEAQVGITKAQQIMLDDVKSKLKDKAVQVEIEKKLAIEYKSGRMTRPTLYVKVDMNNFWSQMFRWKIGWTTDLERREENSVTDNPDLKLWLTLEFETMEEAVNEEHKLHEYFFGLKRRIDQQRPKKYANTNCKEFFYLTKTMLEDLKNEYSWKEYLTIEEIYDTRRK